MSFDGKTLTNSGRILLNEDQLSLSTTSNKYIKDISKSVTDGVNKLRIIPDKEITAKVVCAREVEYGEQIWKLAPLTYKIYEQKGGLNESGAYQGAAYWQYKGKRLRDLPDIN